MSWICPDCEYENEDMLIRCVCGYEIQEDQTIDEIKTSPRIESPDLVLRTNYNISKITSILEEQLDAIPDDLQNLHLFRFRGTSPVCGRFNERGFELRNRFYHMYSLRVYGEFIKSEEGTIIKIYFQKPFFINKFYGFIFNRYKHDKEIILNFLKEWIPLINTAEPLHRDSAADATSPVRGSVGSGYK